jgi:hypothetical protein
MEELIDASRAALLLVPSFFLQKNIILTNCVYKYQGKSNKAKWSL